MTSDSDKVVGQLRTAAGRCESTNGQQSFKELTGYDTPGCGLGAGGLLADVLWMAGRADGLAFGDQAMEVHQ